MEYSRRKFISFLGKASLGVVIAPSLLMGCKGTLSNERLQQLKDLVLQNLSPSSKDDLQLVNGLGYHVVVKWGDKISDQDTFGFNNDFTCFIPFDKNNPKDGLLWVNHEYVNPLFVSDYDFRNPKLKRTKSQVDKEML